MNREEKILSLQQKYQKILLNDGGLQTLCNALIEEVDNPVFLLDKYQDDTIYITKALKADKEFYNYLEEKEIKASEEIFCEYDILIKRVIYDWQGKEVREVQVKLSHNEETLGFLVILEENKLEKDAYIAILQAAYAFSLKLHQNYIVQRLAQKCNSELIEDLVGGRVKSKEELIKRGELAGWDLSLPYQLYTLRIDFSKIYSENNKGTTLYYYELEEQIIRYLHRIIRT
ncbi:MAG: CdaR family transcriptional regulator, partial [Halanaerobium sp. MSAO_Bac5]